MTRCPYASAALTTAAEPFRHTVATELAGEPGLLDTEAAALAAGVTTRTIRRWAHTGRITPQGQDYKGRTTYLLSQVLNATRRTKS